MRALTSLLMVVSLLVLGGCDDKKPDPAKDAAQDKTLKFIMSDVSFNAELEPILKQELERQGFVLDWVVVNDIIQPNEMVDEGQAESRLVVRHEYDASGRDVLIQFPVGTLGDSIAWFSYAARFGERHPGCRVSCAVAPHVIPLFKDAYPDILAAIVEADKAAQKQFSGHGTALAVRVLLIDCRLVLRHDTAGGLDRQITLRGNTELPRPIEL